MFGLVKNYLSNQIDIIQTKLTKNIIYMSMLLNIQSLLIKIIKLVSIIMLINYHKYI